MEEDNEGPCDLGGMAQQNKAVGEGDPKGYLLSTFHDTALARTHRLFAADIWCPADPTSWLGIAGKMKR
jgi:hypothetical protein